MRKNLILIFFYLLICLTSSAQTHHKAQESIEKLAGDALLSQSAVGICVRTGDGRTLVDINAEKMLLPASNMKLISTGLALHKLGKDFRYETGIGYDGEIIDGILTGNLYIIGGADPTLGSEDPYSAPIDSVFGIWTSYVKEAGIYHIEGKVIGDGGYFDKEMDAPTWQLEDIGTYYGTGSTGIIFYENMQSFKVSSGAEVGDSILITPHYPQAPWMDFRYSCTTGEPGTGDRLFMYTSDLAPIAEIRGTFAVDRADKRLDCSNKFPEYTCAWYFHKYLADNGITCSGGVGDSRLDLNWERDGEVRIIGSTMSPAMDKIASWTNHISNNLYAETLLRTLGKELKGSSSYDSSYAAAKDVLGELGVDISYGFRLKDGSGLSRQNYVSADFMCRFLAAMMESPYFEAYASGLPSPGSRGTLSANMKDYPSEIKERIKVKSGSMNGVRCYSGYIIPSEGCKEDTIIFSILTNNCTSSTSKVRQLLDQIMGTLAEMN